MIITIGGSVGSGKTTLAKELARKFSLKHISAGEVMRQMAKERGTTLMEFSKEAESSPEIDREIDARQKELAKKGNCVADGRLSAYMLPSDLRIWLDASLEVRAKRVAKREGTTETDAKKHILAREKSEKKRYKNIYGIDLGDMGAYDLVIKNDRFDVRSTVEIVSAAAKVFNVV